MTVTEFMKSCLRFLLTALLSLLAALPSAAAGGFDPLGASAYHLSYATPRAAGLDPIKLGEIDAIVEEAIDAGATPGAVVLVLKDGKVVFDRAYGHHTYEGAIPTRTSDIFDLASLTKITATTLAAMRLVEEGKLNLDGRLGTYLRELKSSHPDKAAIKIRDLLTHQAGLAPSLPYFEKVGRDDYRSEPSARYPVRVAEHFYLGKDYYRKVMWPRILSSKLRKRGEYVYSDLSMDMLKAVVERLVKQPLDAYVEEQFYRPLGACSMGFCPRQRFPEDRLVPTEIETYFRKQTLLGDVQDPGAAMAGGVAGHAGLFSTAYDLAIIGQMLLNGGSYEGRRYFRPETVRRFTALQSAVSRRGLGFDRFDPEMPAGYPSRLASPATFGHTGFTGTCLWVDPERRLVYVFLSNRTYPPSSRKLISLNIRPRIMDAVYEAMGVVAGERPVKVVQVVKGKGTKGTF